MADVAQAYLEYPGQCWVCATSDPEKGIVDLGTLPGSATQRWRLYLCGECVVGFASSLGKFVGHVVVATEEYENVRVMASEMEAQRARADELTGWIAQMGRIAASATGTNGLDAA